MTKSQTLWVMVNDFALTLYPFIDGRIGGDVGMSEQQWIELGRTVKQIHTSQLPPDLKKVVPRETYVPPRRSVVTKLEEAIEGEVPAEPAQRELVAFWKSRRDQIDRVVSRADALGRRSGRMGAQGAAVTDRLPARRSRGSCDLAGRPVRYSVGFRSHAQRMVIFTSPAIVARGRFPRTDQIILQKHQLDMTFVYRGSKLGQALVSSTDEIAGR